MLRFHPSVNLMCPVASQSTSQSTGRLRQSTEKDRWLSPSRPSMAGVMTGATVKRLLASREYVVGWKCFGAKNKERVLEKKNFAKTKDGKTFFTILRSTAIPWKKFASSSSSFNCLLQWLNNNSSSNSNNRGISSKGNYNISGSNDGINHSSDNSRAEDYDIINFFLRMGTQLKPILLCLQLV